MKFDEIDLRIFQALMKDVRLNASKLAKKLGMTKSALSYRLKKINESGIIIGSNINVNLEKFGYHCLANFGIKTIPSKIEECMEYISSLEAVDVCYPTIGAFNIFVWVSLKDLSELQNTKECIRSHPAILEIKTIIRTNNEKTLIRSENVSLRKLMVV